MKMWHAWVLFISGFVLLWWLAIFSGNNLNMEIAAYNNTLVAEGTYERVSYVPGSFSSTPATIITFKGGKTCALRYINSVNFPVGTYIKVYADGSIRKNDKREDK